MDEHISASSVPFTTPVMEDIKPREWGPSKEWFVEERLWTVSYKKEQNIADKMFLEGKINRVVE